MQRADLRGTTRVAHVSDLLTEIVLDPATFTTERKDMCCFKTRLDTTISSYIHNARYDTSLVANTDCLTQDIFPPRDAVCKEMAHN